jgi:S-adenosylmethionine synthetase
VNTYGTGKVDDMVLAKAIADTFDMTPSGIISRFELKKPGFRKTAAYGHFGRNEFTWEKLDYVDRLSNSVM